jgi:hypothetical protein
MRESGRRFRVPLWVAFVIGAAWSISSSPATPGEIIMADDAAKPAVSEAFTSKSETEAFLARALPAATATNPKYRSPGSDGETQRITMQISFKAGVSRGVVASIFESVRDYRSGALRTHRATLGIDDVAITEETTDDLAENGEKARGVLFTCVGARCIEDQSDEDIHLGSTPALRPVLRLETTMSASADVYLQDETQRRQIIGAFRALQAKSASP